MKEFITEKLKSSLIALFRKQKHDYYECNYCIYNKRILLLSSYYQKAFAQIRTGLNQISTV